VPFSVINTPGVKMAKLRRWADANQQEHGMRTIGAFVITLFGLSMTAQATECKITNRLKDAVSTRVVVETTPGDQDIQTEFLLAAGDSRAFSFETSAFVWVFDEHDMVQGTATVYAADELQIQKEGMSWGLVRFRRPHFRLPPFFSALELSRAQDEELAKLSKDRREDSLDRERPVDVFQEIALEQKYFGDCRKVLTPEQWQSWLDSQQTVYMPDEDWFRLQFTHQQVERIKAVSTGVYCTWLKSVDEGYRAVFSDRRGQDLERRIRQVPSRKEEWGRLERERSQLLDRLRDELLPVLTTEQRTRLNALACRRLIDADEPAHSTLSDEELIDLCLSLRTMNMVPLAEMRAAKRRDRYLDELKVMFDEVLGNRHRTQVHGKLNELAPED
jgi:hypothetical protein